MPDGRSILFRCVRNAGRSQIAAGRLAHLAGDAVEVRSAASILADQVNPARLPIFHPRGTSTGTSRTGRKGAEAVRSIRDEIEARVRRLIAEPAPSLG